MGNIIGLLSPKLASLSLPALAEVLEPLRSPSLWPDTPRILAGQPHAFPCRLGLHKQGPLAPQLFLLFGHQLLHPSPVRPSSARHALVCPPSSQPAVLRFRDTLGVTCSSGGSDVISSSDTPSGTRGACPTPCPVSCLSCSAPLLVVPEVGPRPGGRLCQS